MKRTNVATRILAAAALCIGMATPFLASANDYGSYLKCLRHCAGSCSFSGQCFLIEK